MKAGDRSINSPNKLHTPLLDSKELADHLKLHVCTIYKFRKEGMPGFVLGWRRGKEIVRYRVSAVEAWLRNRATVAADVMGSLGGDAG